MTTLDAVLKFLKSGEERGLSRHTVRWYRGILNPFANIYPTLPQDPESIEQFIGSFTSGDERRHGAFRVIRTFYSFLAGRYDLPNPMLRVRPPRVRPKEKPTLSLEQLKTLLDYPSHPPMVRALLFVLAATGVRLSEAGGLVGKDILDNNRIKVNGKTGARVIPVFPAAYEQLVNIMPLSTAEDQRLFPYTTFWLSRLVSRAMRSVGLDAFSAHSLRHTFCSLFAGSDSALKYITGHRSWKMIEHYRHHKDAHAIEQYQKHNPLAMIYGNRRTERTTGVREDTLVSDDMARFLVNMPDLDAAPLVAQAKFLFHSYVYNFAQVACDRTSKAAKACCTGALISMWRRHQLLGDDVGLDDPEVVEETKRAWELLIPLFAKLSSEHFSQAVIYQELCGDDIDIEKLTFVKPEEA